MLVAYALALLPPTLAGMALGFSPGNRQRPFEIIIVALTVAAYFTVLPAIAVVSYCEWRGKRSKAIYIWSGIVIGVLTSLVLGGNPVGQLAHRHLIYVYGVLAGGTSGLIYWAVAGRLAGLWREPRSGATRR
jgi:hypothetical protein